MQNSRLNPGDFDASAIVFRWQWDGIVENTPGKYRVRVFLTGGNSSEIPVCIVEDYSDESKEQEKSYLRFAEPLRENKVTTETEIWHFEPEEIRRARDYMKQRKNPFSSETNREFFLMFQNCRQAGEGEFR